MSDNAQMMNISVPHRLGREEARRRIADGFGRLQTSNLPLRAAEHWTGDRLDFKITALGQAIDGFAEVREDRVDVSVRLPWLLAKLAATLRPQLEQQTRKALEAKSAPRPDAP